MFSVEEVEFNIGYIMRQVGEIPLAVDGFGIGKEKTLGVEKAMVKGVVFIGDFKRAGG